MNRQLVAALIALGFLTMPGAFVPVQAANPTNEELARHLNDLFGLDPLPDIPESGFCKPGAGCLPAYVDEEGDTMTGVLRMLNTDIEILEEGAIRFPGVGAASGDSTDASFISSDGAFFAMPINLNNEVALADGAQLNTSAGSEIFIDWDGVLRFADGSLMRPGTSYINNTWFFNETLEVNKTIIIKEEGNIIFENNTGVLTDGNLSRVGTFGERPFEIVVFNDTAYKFWPASTPVLIGGHGDNHNTTGIVGAVIMGGGSADDPNRVAGDYAVVLGGLGNAANADHTTAGGVRAHANHVGSTVLSDSQDADFNSTGTDQFLVRAQNGVGINTDSPVSALTVAGNITPATNDMYALGSPDNRWHLLYMASIIDYGSDQIYMHNGETTMILGTNGTLHVLDRILTGTMNATTFNGDGSGLTGVVASEVGEGAVGTLALADGAVTTPKLADGAVTSVKLLDGAVSNTKLAANSVTTAKIIDAAITSAKIQDDAVTTSKLADGSVSAAKLGEACTAGQVLKHDGTRWGCGTDIDTDTDTDTTYTPGAGLLLSGTTFSANTSFLQARVAGACAADEAISLVNADGTVSCIQVGSNSIPWGSVTGKPAGFADDVDDDTTYTSGAGLALSGTEFSVATSGITSAMVANGAIGAADVDSSAVQLRIGSTCAAGSSIRAIASDGTVTCETDDDADTTYANGTGLNLVGTTFSADTGYLQQRVASTCAAGSSIRAIASDGTVTCETDDDTDTDTTYTSGPGLALSGTEFSVASGGITSAMVANGAIGSADVDSSAVQLRIGSTCAAGSSIRAIAPDGTVTCETDDDTDTTYTATGPLELTGTAFGMEDCPGEGVDPAILRFDAGSGWSCTRVGSSLIDGSAVTSGHIAAGTIKASDVNLTEIQKRVASVCAAGSSIRAIAADGTVTCETDDVGSDDAATLDGLDSTQFLRSDSSDSFTSGTLTIGSGADLNLTGSLDSDIVPKTNDKFMLGNSTHRFSDLWLASKIHYSSPLEFESGGQDRVVLSTDGSLTATGFSGDGSGLTGVSADDADTLDALDSSQFLRSDTTDAMAGTLTVTGDILVGDELSIDGDRVFMGQAGPDQDQSFYFYDGGSQLGERIFWDESHDEFEFSNDVFVEGGVVADSFSGDGSGLTGVTVSNADTVDSVHASQFLRSDVNDTFDAYELVIAGDGGLKIDRNLTVGARSASGDDFIYFKDGINEWIGWEDTGEGSGWFRISDRTSIDGVVENTGHAWIGGIINLDGNNVYVNHDGGEATQNLFFYEDASAVAEYLRWDDSADEFVLSDTVFVEDDLEVQDAVRVGTRASSDDDFIYFDDGVGEHLMWDNSAGEFAFSSALEVTGDVTATDDLVANNRVFVNMDGPDQNQHVYFYDGGSPFAEALRWDDALDAFDLTDELRLADDLHVGYLNAADDDFIYFDQAVESIKWDDGAQEFSVSDDWAAEGNLEAGGDMLVGMSSSSDDDYLYFDDGVSAYMQWLNTPEKFIISHFTRVNGPFETESWISIGEGSTTDDDSLIFDDGFSQYLRWVDSADEFLLSNDLDIQGSTFEFGSAESWYDGGANRVQTDDSLAVTQGGVCIDSDGGCIPPAAGHLKAFVIDAQGHSDVAEVYPSQDVLVPGDVVVLDPANPGAVRKATAADPSHLLLVVSEHPGLLLGAPSDEDLVEAGGIDAALLDPDADEAAVGPIEPNFGSVTVLPGTYPVALSGRVPVMVSAVNGVVETGDSLTLSDVPGVARKANPGEPILGRALEGALDVEGAQVMAFVTPGAVAPGAPSVEEYEALEDRVDTLEAQLAALTAMVEEMAEDGQA